MLPFPSFAPVETPERPGEARLDALLELAIVLAQSGASLIEAGGRIRERWFSDLEARPDTLRQVDQALDAIMQAMLEVEQVGAGGATPRNETLRVPGEVRHDMGGFYFATPEECDYEDDGHASVGFDGREHWATEAEAIAATNAAEGDA